MSLEFQWVNALGNSLHKTYGGHHKPCLPGSQPIFIVVWVVFFDLANFCLWFSIMRECRTTFPYWHMRNLASTKREIISAKMPKTLCTDFYVNNKNMGVVLSSHKKNFGHLRTTALQICQNINKLSLTQLCLLLYYQINVSHIYCLCSTWNRSLLSIV